MQKEIREIRVKIDTLAQIVSKSDKTRELSLAKTHLEEAKMRLGKVLQEIGEPNPYPNSRNPNNDIIEPTADTIKLSKNNKEVISHIASIKTLRLEIKNLCIDIEELMGRGAIARNIKASQYCLFAYMSLDMAGMWLGMQLGTMRDESSPINKEIPGEGKSIVDNIRDLFNKE